MPHPEEFSPGNKEVFETKRISVLRPAVESLISPDTENSLWPATVRNNDLLKEQAALRRELLSDLENIFKDIPQADTEIEKAYEAGHLEAARVQKTYEQLLTFLEADPYNERVLLYLPFELLPQKNWDSGSPEVNEAIEAFRNQYLSRWRELLQTHDLRANFNDGDVPEPEIRKGPLPEVSKAAHLIPILVQKEWITPEEVLMLLEKSDDEILKESIADTLPVLTDMNLLPEKTLEEMIASQNSFIRNIGIIVKSNQETSPKVEEIVRDEAWLQSTISEITESLEKVEAVYSENLSTMPARARWQRQKEISEITDKYAEEVATALSKNELSLQNITDLMDSNPAFIPTGISAIRIAVQKGVALDTEELFKKLWDKNVPEIQNEIRKTLLYWHNLGIISKEYLDTFEITPINLDKEIFLPPMLTEQLREISASIESDPRLSEFIHDVIIVYGSKIKGYDTNADTDLAVFVKPDISIDQRNELQALLTKLFSSYEIDGHALEFWLTPSLDSTHFDIKDFPNPDTSLGDSTLTHVLFGGIWIGSDATIKQLYEKALAPYFFSDKEIFGKDAREIWLHELERDALQYRLMHKGYAKFHPAQGGIHTDHSDSIDGESMFFDSGFRRLATKLFLKKVFLPKLH